MIRVDFHQAVIALRRGAFFRITAPARPVASADSVAPPDRRRGADTRTACDPTLVRIAVEGEFIPVQAHVVNVSEFGVGLRLNRPFPFQHDGMQITIEMYPVLITGCIRFCTQKRNTKPFEMGVLISEIVRLSGSAPEARQL
jgi:hypothetical protein